METYTISGRLTKDSEYRMTTAGNSLLKFSVACNRYNAKTKFYDCAIWGKRADTLKSILTKGVLVNAIGVPRVNEYNGNVYESLECTIVEPVFTAKKESQQENHSDYEDKDIDELSSKIFDGGEDDMNIPF